MCTSHVFLNNEATNNQNENFFKFGKMRFLKMKMKIDFSLMKGKRWNY